MKHEGHPCPLLAAKTTPPRLRDACLRDEQLARVAEAAGARLLLVRAPAGYGKTTLIAAAAAEFDWSFLWYRLDASDAEPSSFLASLAEALDLRLPSEGATAGRSRLSFDELPAMVTGLAARLAQSDDPGLYLVLDDYDALGSSAQLDAAVAILLALLPPAVHLVVLARRRPAFASAKLELDGEMAAVTYRDLLLERTQVARVLERESAVGVQ